MGLFDAIFGSGRGSADAKLADSIFNLKFTAKTLARAAKKCEQEEKANRNKVRRRVRCAVRFFRVVELEEIPREGVLAK